MEFASFVSGDVFNWVVLPLLIFLARIADVSLGTLRVIFISRGFKFFAPILGFFEVIIWLIAINQIMGNLTNWFYYIAYGGGFAAGTFTGMYLEEKLSIGKVMVRVITKRDASILLKEFRDSKYVVTATNAEGSEGNVKVIFTIVNRQHIPHVVNIINRFNPSAFYSIEEVKFASEEPSLSNKRYPNLFGFYRKGK